MKIKIFTGVFVSAIICGCASQQDVITLNDRLAAQKNQSEKKVSQLNLIVEEQNKAAQDLREQNASLRITIDKLREDFQAIRGRLEESDHFLKQQQMALDQSEKQDAGKLERIDETIMANSDRIKRIEQYLGLERFEKKGTGESEKSDSVKEMTEDERYNLSVKAMDKGNYESAREGFRDIIKKYPASDNADNAQFWIGETYYREKWYEKAILEYKEVVDKYPKGNKVPAALLKQGLAFQQLGDTATARIILNGLIEKYPKSSEAEVANKTLKGFK